jgi:hypothetical protein
VEATETAQNAVSHRRPHPSVFSEKEERGTTRAT